MRILQSKRQIFILTGILLILICGGLWISQDTRLYDNARVHTSDDQLYTDVAFTDQGDDAASLSIRPSYTLNSSTSVPVTVYFWFNQSRYRMDSLELMITRQYSGDVFFKGYQKEYPVHFWRESGQTHVVSRETYGFWGESSQAFEFILPRSEENDTISIDIDARLSETGPFWKHGHIQYHLPSAFTINGYRQI